MRNSRWATVLLVAAIGSAACTQSVGDDEVMTTDQAVERVTEIWCNDCFEETSGGGAGSSREGGGTNGFVGGIVGYANGTGRGGETRVANPGDCPPDTDCVEVHGESRPLSDSEIRITIYGAEKGHRVDVDLPKGRGRPASVKWLGKLCVKGGMIAQCGGNDNNGLFDRCLEAAATKKAWEAFIAIVAKVNAEVAERLRGGGQTHVSRVNMCAFFFGS